VSDEGRFCERSFVCDVCVVVLERMRALALPTNRPSLRMHPHPTRPQKRASARPLKLVVTSATLDGEKFAAYFGNGCPVLSVPGRAYPVDVIHAREDPGSDYVGAAVDAVLQVHTGQPEGALVWGVARKGCVASCVSQISTVQRSLKRLLSCAHPNTTKTKYTTGDILVFLTGQAEIEKAIAAINAAVCALPAGSADDLLVLPLHASLPPELQLRVFRPGPPGARRCIVATNVAETSITGAFFLAGWLAAWLGSVCVDRGYRPYSPLFSLISSNMPQSPTCDPETTPQPNHSVDGVVYVIDSGVVKQRHHHPESGMDSLDVVPISRVQATQRAGRAGRTRPGKVRGFACVCVCSGDWAPTALAGARLQHKPAAPSHILGQQQHPTTTKTNTTAVLPPLHARAL
jgi:ATP-dependent RNA helicase DHX8/PRP22